MEENYISLLELNNRLQRLVQQPQTQNVWVIAELSDVQVRGGHCYMELLQKDDRGVQIAKARGTIWASNYGRISLEFMAATGQQFATGLKVMLRVSANFHPIYGLSLNINAVNPEYTMGDLLRRRQEILARLKAEGILEMNRQLEWPTPLQRIAIISAPGAAGYGDFINQLYNNPSHLRFETKLFPAVMQGEKAPSSIIAALEAVAAEFDQWDGVVIIRGGGATSDLQAFEDYDLAANVAQFPLPIAIGIGHERDVTVLDYIARERLKTPTAVAEWLIAKGENELGIITTLGNRIAQLSTQRLTGYKEQLAHCSATLPQAAQGAIERANLRLTRSLTNLSNISARRIYPQLTRLDITANRLAEAGKNCLQRQHNRLDQCTRLVEVLSPSATLARGYSITRINGHAVTDPSTLKPGDILETTFAKGTATSTVK